MNCAPVIALPFFCAALMAHDDAVCVVRAEWNRVECAITGDKAGIAIEIRDDGWGNGALTDLAEYRDKEHSYVLTAKHVITDPKNGDADKIMVEVDGKEHLAEIDKKFECDICLLKIEKVEAYAYKLEKTTKGYVSMWRRGYGQQKVRYGINTEMRFSIEVEEGSSGTPVISGARIQGIVSEYVKPQGSFVKSGPANVVPASVIRDELDTEKEQKTSLPQEKK